MWRRFRPVIGIQVLLTLVGALLVGGQTAPSVLMGGAVGTAGAVVFVAMASRKTQATSATEVLIGALLAEGAKLLVIALLLWLAVSSYPELVLTGFVGAFIMSILIFSLALFIGDTKTLP